MNSLKKPIVYFIKTTKKMHRYRAQESFYWKIIRAYLCKEFRFNAFITELPDNEGSLDNVVSKKIKPQG